MINQTRSPFPFLNDAIASSSRGHWMPQIVMVIRFHFTWRNRRRARGFPLKKSLNIVRIPVSSNCHLRGDKALRIEKVTGWEVRARNSKEGESGQIEREIASQWYLSANGWSCSKDRQKKWHLFILLFVYCYSNLHMRYFQFKNIKSWCVLTVRRLCFIMDILSYKCCWS